MRQLLIKAFKDTAEQIKVNLAMMPLERWSESIFRFMYSQAVAKQERGVKQFLECGKIDLVLHRESERAFLEFKFYLHAARYDPLCGNKIGWKGGPGLKTFREFKTCVQTLRGRPALSKVLKLVALFYSDPVDTKRKTFEGFFGDRSGVERKLNIRRLVSIGLASDGSEIACNARLYEVRG